MRPTAAAALSILGLPAVLGQDAEEEYVQETMVLCDRVLEELIPLTESDTEREGKPMGNSMMQELLLHAWDLPDDSPEHRRVQYMLLDFVSQTRRTMPHPSLANTTAHREGIQQTRAMLSAIEASIPICRTNHVCVVDKMSMMMWRFAEGGGQDLLNAGEAWPFFKKMKPYMPAHARWETPWQCPTTLLPGIEARPFWTVASLPPSSTAARLAAAFESNYQEIARELQEGILSDEGLAFVKDPAWSGLARGSWVAFSVFRSGGFFGRNAISRQLDAWRCRLTPRTCDILRRAGAPPGMVNSLPSLQGAQEVVDFLKADPGTTVMFHAASTNSRLTVQVCLAGCSIKQGSEGRSFVQAGPATVDYELGKPVIFDDSFLHRVIVDPENDGPRWVLSVQVLHPKIDSVDGFAEHFASYSPNPLPDDKRELPENGGPVPPALDEDADSAYPSEALTFHNSLDTTVLVFWALWGPDQDGPDVFLGEVPGLWERPHDAGRGLQLPRLAHRTRLSARSVSDGEEIAAWRVDARQGGARRFALAPDFSE